MVVIAHEIVKFRNTVTATSRACQQGYLWAWGCNDDGMLGIGSGVAKQQVPARVETSGKRIRHAAGGWRHFLAVTEDGELLSCLDSLGTDHLS